MNAIRSSCVASYVFTVFLALVVVLGAANKVWAQDDENGDGIEKGEHIEATTEGNIKAYMALAAALTMATSCIAAGYAVAKIGAAAMGAASEKPEIMGRAMLFVAIAEGIAIYGLIIAVFILNKI